MYALRFNPAFGYWVLLGEPLPREVSVKPGQLIKTTHGTKSGFLAASFPRSPFVLDAHPAPRHDEPNLVYNEESPIGEYELLLYTGGEGFYQWSAKEWSQWLVLVSDRLRQLHHNPSLVFAHLMLHTRGLATAGPEYQRVGDLIATSHPLIGGSQPLTEDVVEKIRRKEDMFVIEHTAAGDLYIPSAPLHENEIWYLPQLLRTGIETLEAAERTALAETLSRLFGVLHAEFPKEEYVLEVHTAMAGSPDGHTWWIQIYRYRQELAGPLTAIRPPERFAYLMHSLLAQSSKKRK